MLPEMFWKMKNLITPVKATQLQRGEERNREEGEMAKKSREEGENEMLGEGRDG